MKKHDALVLVRNARRLIVQELNGNSSYLDSIYDMEKVFSNFFAYLKARSEGFEEFEKSEIDQAFENLVLWEIKYEGVLIARDAPFEVANEMLKAALVLDEYVATLVESL